MDQFNKYKQNKYSRVSKDDPSSQTFAELNSQSHQNSFLNQTKKSNGNSDDRGDPEREDFTTHNSYQNPEGVRIFTEPSGFTAVVMIEDVCPEKLFMTVRGCCCCLRYRL